MKEQEEWEADELLNAPTSVEAAMDGRGDVTRGSTDDGDCSLPVAPPHSHLIPSCSFRSLASSLNSSSLPSGPLLPPAPP